MMSLYQNTKYQIMSCSLCPRHCQTDRLNSLGFCGAPLSPHIAAVCRHRGEEPPISGQNGICNIFFAHCNLQCVYCQNYEISRPKVDPAAVRFSSVEELARQVADLLPSCDNMLGLVSPSHYAHLVPQLIETIREMGIRPTVVYNTNAYDDVQTLRMLEPYIDIYLPDFKYMSSDLAALLSNAPDYPQKASLALKEMFRQKGSALLTDDKGLAFSGIIVRHLVLPGFVDNSLRCLDWLADNLSLKLHISLMSQYFPSKELLEMDGAKEHLPQQLFRSLSLEEYQPVTEHLHELGFYNGWTQDFSSSQNYRPDFSSDAPFSD